MEDSLPGSKSKILTGIPISKGIAWVILAIALTFTGIYSYNTKKWVENEAAKEFSFECNEIKARVYTRLHAQAQLLRTGAALFEASDSVSRMEWGTFINHQQIERNLPGVEGVGYTVIVSGNLFDKHVQQIRSSGFSEYTIMPSGSRNLYTSVIYLEPFSDRNLRAFGYDMFTDTVRRAAMQKATDSSEVALSGKVVLVQENKPDSHSGVLMFIPVYRTGMPLTTVAGRRKAIKGWVFSPYRMNDFMRGILSEHDTSLNEKIRLQIYENNGKRAGAWLFDSESVKEAIPQSESILELSVPFDFYGKQWTLYFSEKLQIRSFYFHKNVLTVLAGGTTISLLFFLLALLLMALRNRLKVTTSLAHDLKAGLDKHVALYNAIPDAVFVTDSITGIIEENNSKATQQYGYSILELRSITGSGLSLSTEHRHSQNFAEADFFHEQFHVKKDGTIFPVEITSSNFEIDNSKKTITVVRDISERLKAETDLKFKNEVFENSIAAQSIADVNGTITHVNKAFLGMWNLGSKDTAIGRTIESFFVEKSDAAQVMQSLETHEAWQGEFRARRDDGSVFITRAFAKTLRGRHGDVIGYQSTNIDISREKENETRLLEYKAAIDQAVDGIAIAGLNHEIRFVNQAWAHMHGYAIDELAACDISLFHTPEQLQDEVYPYIAIVGQSGANSGEIGHKHRQGNTFPTWMSASLLKDSNQNPTGYLAVAQDITLRKAAEAALENSKDHYRKLVENANDAIVVSIPDQIAFANQKFFDILGYDEAEVIAGSYLRYIHPDDQEALINKYMSLFEGGTLHKYQARILTKEGTTRWAEFSGIVIEWDGLSAVLSFIADITDRVLAEQNLNASEELYKSTIKASPDDITVTDINGVILMISPAALPLFGFDNEHEIIGRHLQDFLIPEDWERANSSIDLLLKGQGLSPADYTCIRKNGSLLETEINGEIINDENGQAKGFVFIIRDITSRKRAEEDLRESEEKWRSLVNNSPDFIALHDKEGNYLYLNHFAEGYSEKDILGRSAFEFLSPDTKALFIEKHQESISTWKPVKFEHIAFGNMGQMRIYEETLVPLLTKNSEINILAVAKDITEHKQSELKLKEQEEHFRLIFENGTMAMALVNADMQFTQVNKAFVNFIGYTESELVKMTFADISDPENIDQDRQQVKRLLKREISIYRTEKKYITRYKKTVWGLVQVSAMYNKAGEFHSLLVMISNISERKKAEESLLKSEEIFNQFMLNSPIYVFFKDEQIRSLRLSRNFEQMLGRPLNELLGKTMYELFPSELAKKMVADDLQILHEGKQVEVEEEMNGRYYSTTKFPIFIEGKPTYLAGYTIDVTSRKLAGELIHAALKEKEILLREVHHRVKNNLQVVSSLLNLQANNMPDSKFKATLEQSRNRIRSIALVHEKLYQSGDFAEINLKDYTQSLLIELFRVYLADPNKIHFRSEIEDVTIPLIYAIPIGLILNEIISNSLKYAFPESHTFDVNPEIFVSLKMLPDGNLQLCAGDNGIGLPDNYQLTDSTSLGLYLIHILSTEQLDGKIEILNKKGAIFTVTFNPHHK